MASLLLTNGGPISASPLDWIHASGPEGAQFEARDGRGRVYHRGPSPFRAAGALGLHRVVRLSDQGEPEAAEEFTLDAQTTLEDEEGVFADLLRMCLHTIQNDCEGVFATRSYKGTDYPCFVQWILDHVHVAEGARWFWKGAKGLPDLFAAAQRENGMVWSFVEAPGSSHYFLDAYGPHGFAVEEGGAVLVRQPVENHNEYMFVEGIWLAWQASGDENWAARMAEAGLRALNYTLASPLRWSKRFDLPKRGCTVDSWDFQIEDENLVPFPLGSAQQVDEKKTKFGVFFGDCHGYALSCLRLSVILDSLGRTAEAEDLRRRADGVHARIKSLAWNGKFFRHWVPEDDDVVRDLGVDESQQIAMSHGYALNRGVDQEVADQIVATYQEFRRSLPKGSPGEWYAIYPPFERGMGGDNGKWQYMNGGVHGHAAGEFARGALTRGAEEYGVDILRRLHALGKKHGDRIYFAYTGADSEEPAPAEFLPVDVPGEMSFDSEGPFPWLRAGDGNDMAGLPRGLVELAGVPWSLEKAAAISKGDGGEAVVKVSLGSEAKAGAVYLLHCVSGGSWTGAPAVAGKVILEHPGGVESEIYVEAGRHVAGWWYPSLSGENCGLAWEGPNAKCSRVGMSWCCLPSPRPELPVVGVRLEAGPDPTRVWAVGGLTLSDRMPWSQPPKVSGGGPDNWSAGLIIAALVEGLAGVNDKGRFLQTPELSPRWRFTASNSARVIARYAEGEGYVAYLWERTDKGEKVIVTGSGDSITVLLSNTPHQSPLPGPVTLEV